MPSISLESEIAASSSYALRSDEGSFWLSETQTDRLIEWHHKVSRWKLRNAEALELLGDIDHESVGEDYHWDFPYAEAFTFLVGSIEYQHLLITIRTILYLTSKDGTLCEKINLSILSILGEQAVQSATLIPICAATFEVVWDPIEFMLGQEYEKGSSQELKEVIKLTRGAVNAQAMPCGGHSVQTWL
ncbi:uncharacterized protein RAG0_01731 [Rhynchosporium agropyri]|uniref:Uncharacterized protein n=1 Tax=Rhynchosporium agropyri TaxID=914238 RepID=A0A1E1JYE0_9HELO|nr:uncharacterized protein RAG0_01731 [Rhynchosporium agropyri]